MKLTRKVSWWLLALLGSGLLSLGALLGWWGAGHLYEEVQARQLSRLLGEDLAGLMEAERYAAIPGLFEHFSRSRQIHRLAWVSPAGRIREQRGPHPETLPPPNATQLVRGPSGNVQIWSQLPVAPGEETPDWLFLELTSLTPSRNWGFLPLALTLLGLVGIRRLRVSPGEDPAEGEGGEVLVCPDASEDSESCSQDSSQSPS